MARRGFALVLILLCPLSASAAPQRLRVMSMRLSADPTGGEREGALRFDAVVQDSDTGPTIDAVLLTNTVVVNIRDAGAFNVDIPLQHCHACALGVRCATGQRNRAILTSAGSSGARLQVSARLLPGRITGRTSPIGPVRVTLAQNGSAGRVDVITDCAAMSGSQLRCRDRRHPNIVYIVTDDQRADTVQYMPHALELLGAQGVSFTNAFATTPVCGPSRASMLTGLYARHHQVLTNAGVQGGAPALVGPDSSTIATWLHDAGYRTGMYGKYMVGYAAQCPPYRTSCYQPPGWDEWHVFLTQHYYDYTLSENGQDVRYGNTDAEYSTDVITAKSVEFIRSAQGQPFFLHIGYHAPHGEASGWPISATRHRWKFRGLPPWLPRPLPQWQPPSWDEEDINDKPSWFDRFHRADDILSGTLTWGGFGEDVRLLQLEAALAVDDGIESIVQALEETGQADNTVIVFTSDNGYFWGEHRIFGGKDLPQEESIRIPLVIRYPRLIKEPRTESALVLNIDIPPTVAQLAGVEPPANVDGVSLKPILRQEETAVRDDFVLEWWNLSQAPGLPTYAGVRSRDWKYVTYPSAGEAELYDLAADPYELDNLAHDGVHEDVVATLQHRLDTLLAGSSTE